MHQKTNFTYYRHLNSSPTKSASLHSPSPDKKSANRVQPTLAPVSEIHKYFTIKPHNKNQQSNKTLSYNKLKQSHLLNYRSLVRELNVEVEENFWHINDHDKICYLIRQIGKHQQYARQYEQLAERNKRLEEQMCLLLVQLEKINEQKEQQRSIEAKNAMSTPSTRAKRQLFSDKKFWGGDPHIDSHQQEQTQNLYEYIEEMENTISELRADISGLQSQLRKNVKQDVTAMEQRLMNYIFSLEEKLGQVSLIKPKQAEQNKQIPDCGNSSKRNHQINEMVKMQKSEFEKIIISDQQSSGLQPRYSNFGLVHPHQKNHGNSSESNKQQSIQTPAFDVRKYSNASVMNLDISDSYNKSNYQELLEFDQDHQLLSSRKSPVKAHKETFICKNCLVYLKKIKQLEQQIQKSQKKNHKAVADKVMKKLDILQSQVNVMVEESSVQEIQDALSIQINHKTIKQSKEKASVEDKYYVIGQIRSQLVNLMQDIQQVIHYCESQEQNNKTSSIIDELDAKIRQQEHIISQYEEDIGRLKLELEESHRERQKFEKILKAKIKEQEKYEPTSFRLITQPISCVDHKMTKHKINHILESMRNFSQEVNCKSAPGLLIKESNQSEEQNDR